LLAQREPYYAVLTDERYLQERLTAETREQFFATGEADVQRVFERIGPGFLPSSALDFGCGIGRLTLALTKRVQRVVGVDIAPTMIERARENVRGAEFSTQLPLGEFDLVVSLIVLQHIPVPEGMRLVGNLLERVAPNGAIALQLTVARSGSVIRRAARRLRSAVPIIHRIASFAQGTRPLPYMQMNAYDLDRIYTLFRAAGCVQVVEETTNHGGIEGRLLIARKLHST
jgi:trans-aconitate methyltransferase